MVLGTFTMKARTRGRDEKAEDVNPNQVTALRCQFTPEYTRPAAIGTTRALLQGVEFEKWLEAAVDEWELPAVANRMAEDPLGMRRVMIYQ